MTDWFKLDFHNLGNININKRRMEWEFTIVEALSLVKYDHLPFAFWSSTKTLIRRCKLGSKFQRMNLFETSWNGQCLFLILRVPYFDKRLKSFQLIKEDSHVILCIVHNRIAAKLKKSLRKRFQDKGHSTLLANDHLIHFYHIEVDHHVENMFSNRVSYSLLSNLDGRLSKHLLDGIYDLTCSDHRLVLLAKYDKHIGQDVDANLVTGLCPMIICILNSLECILAERRRTFLH